MSFTQVIFLVSYLTLVAVVADNDCVTDVDISKFPFMVSIQNDNGDHICSGILIATKMVYTWADLADVDYKSLKATAGITKLTDSGQQRERGATGPVNLTAPGTTLYFGMIVEEEFDLNKNVQVGKLNNNASIETITFVGWGPEKDANLQMLTMDIMSDQDCQRLVDSKGASSDISSYVCGRTRDSNCEKRCFEGQEGPIVQNNEIIGKRYRMSEPLCFPGEYIFLTELGMA